VPELLARVHELPLAKKSAIETLTRKHLEGVNWLGIHFIANAVTFSLLGLILGVLRVHKYVLLVPICLLPATLSILGAEEFFVRTRELTIIVGLFTQFVAVYLFSKVGVWIRTKWARNSEVSAASS